MSNIKAVFFDNDGLLVDTESLYLDATREIFAPYGVEVPLDWYIHQHLGEGVSVFGLLLAKGIPEQKIAELQAARYKRYEEMLGGIRAIDGVIEVLEQLHGKFILAVVTSGRKESLDIVTHKTGLGHFFDFVITSDDVKNTKPDPEPYLKAIELSGQEKAHCLALEDSSKGARAAKAAGITCFAIPDALTKFHDLSMADKVLGSIREVPTLLGL